MSLKAKALRGFFWNSCERASVQIAGFITSVILARLLAPSEFGLIGMMTVVLALAQVALDSGFGQALIQKKDASDTDGVSVFFFNLVASLVLIAMVCAAAPLVATFFRQPLLTPLLRVMSVSFLINALGIVHSANLIRALNFKVLMHIGLASAVLSGAAGIGAALRGAGVWALVLQSIVAGGTRTALLWWADPWRPSRSFEFGALRRLFRFSSNILATGVIATLFENLYAVLIGKWYSADMLGYYVRANRLQRLPAENLMGTLNSVLFPVLSTQQDNPEKLRSIFERSLRVAVCVNFPLMMGLCAVAQPLMLLLFTEKWAASVPMFQILCFSSLFFPLHVLNLSVLLARGRSNLYLRLEIIKKSIFILVVAAAISHGVTGLLWGLVVFDLVCAVVNTTFARREIGLGLTAQVRLILPYLALSLAMFGLAWWVAGQMPGPWSALLVPTAVGALFYAGTVRLLRLKVCDEISSLVAGLRARS